MSTFQISLAVVGVIVLGLIVAYNAWTHRRNEPKRPHSDMHADELEARFDPALDSASASTERNVAGSSHAMLADGLLNVAPGAERQDAAAYEAAADSAVQEALSARTLQAVADKKHALDGLIDAIASIKLEHAITGDAALLVQPTTRRAGSKPFRIEGLNEACGEWESVRSGQRYIAFQAGVQLANRLGALNEIEFSEFVSKVQSFADALNAAVDLPDMLQEVGRARELDQFASEHDAQLSFMLRPRRAA